MKNFVIRTFAIVVALVLLFGAVYTCIIEIHKNILNSQLVEAEKGIDSDRYHSRVEADREYTEVLEKHDEFYYGGGYRSWLVSSHAVVQFVLFMVSLAIICIELYILFIVLAAVCEQLKSKNRKYA